MPLDDREIGINPERRIGNPRPLGRTLPVIPSSGYGIVSDVRTRIVFGGLKGDDTTDPPPFYPVSIAIADAGGYKVTVQPGTVACWNPRVPSDTLPLYIPEIGGLPMNNDPRPFIVAPPGKWVVASIKTDHQNQITETPEIGVSEDGEDGDSYVPDVADTEGADGGYFVKLFKIDDLDGTPVVTPGIQSDIILSPYLWTGENYGTGAGRCLKDYDPETSTYRFRTHGEGYAVEIKEVGDTIEPWFLAKNVGEGAPVYIEPDEDEVQAGDKAEFNTIGGRPSGDVITRQINVDPAIPPSGADPGTPIVVKGNGKSGKRTLRDSEGNIAWEIEWVDGLIISDGEQEYQDRCSCDSNNYYSGA